VARTDLLQNRPRVVAQRPDIHMQCDIIESVTQIAFGNKNTGRLASSVRTGQCVFAVASRDLASASPMKS
jgi:hypothetical protein